MFGPDLEHGGEGDGGGEVRRGEAEAGGHEDGVEVGVLSVRIVVKERSNSGQRAVKERTKGGQRVD